MKLDAPPNQQAAPPFDDLPTGSNQQLRDLQPSKMRSKN